MMKPLRDVREALRRLRSQIAADSEPTLRDDEVMDLLMDHQIAKVWTAETVVQVGDVIVPTVPTGWYYTVSPLRDQDGIPGGITGTVEPKWPLDPRWPSWEPTTVDDGSIRFTIHRAEKLGLWDIQSAVHAGWMLKARKASEMTDFTNDRIGGSDSQVYDHCIHMARLSAPIRVSI